MKPIIYPLSPDTEGQEVVNLQESLLFFLDKKIIREIRTTRVPAAENLTVLAETLKRELSRSIFGKATTELVRIFQVQQELGDDLRGAVEEKTALKINELLKQLGVLEEPSREKLYSVKGRIINNKGVALAGYTVKVFIITLQREIAAGSAGTNRNGEYSISYKNPLAIAPDIEVRADKTGDERNISRSAVRYNASADEKLDVIVNAAKEKEASEFDLIINDVRVHLGNTKLSDLKEDATNRNITYLANKTGWDSRVTAMLVSSHQMGSSLKIDPSHVYALLRAGVPATEDAIKSLSLQDVKASIENATKKNVISAGGNVAETLKILESHAVPYLLNSRPYASVSTMGEMLDIRLNANQKNIFATVRKQAGSENTKLWSVLAEKGFAADTIAKLKLDGKLGYLTGRNVPLMKKVYEKFNLQSDVDLVKSGLYKSSAWENILDSNIPAGITASEYATHMADQVKLSYPTAVTGEMIKRGEVFVSSNAPKNELVNFFYGNTAKNSIGKQPVKTWDGFDHLSPEAQSTAKMVERIYQVSPSDESMIALSKAGINSAFQIAGYSQSEFIATYGSVFPDKQEAAMTYLKANEVYAAALGIATTYLTSQTMPNIYSISGKLAKEQNDIVVPPTLEKLLGNMDYCDCDHCKSVLSPAAYLVELLQFIDLKNIPHSKSNPIDALKARRPDIENIQLTCENTNMALPYIDLVNEILEYYVVNGNLTGLEGHDVTEGTTQAELLAEPRFVNKTAYEELKKKVFPWNLPFHQPLETLRLLFKMWDVTLENMLSIFSSPLLSRIESLGFNEDEYKTVTDLTYKKLPEYFGEPANNTITQLNNIIANGKTFCRRVGISYEELVSLLKTHFINPGVDRIPLFQKLGISLENLNKFYKGTVTWAQLKAMIPDDINPDDYDGDIKEWLQDNEQLIMGLITLTDTGAETAECDFAKVELRVALPDNSANRLTSTAYHKFHRFLRLMRKTGWGINVLDKIMKVLLPVPASGITDGNMDAVFVQLFDRIANFKKIAGLLSFSEKKFPELLLVLDPTADAELRKVQCAKILKLSIPEMAELSLFTGINPLANDMEADEPSLMKSISISRQLKNASLKIVDLAYLLLHHDLPGKLTPSEESLLTNIKILRDTLNGVEKENKSAPDNADYNFARGKMLLVYDAATTSSFFELLMGTKTFSAPLITVEEGLPDKLNATNPKPGFDPFKKVLTFAGVMSASAKTALGNAADNLLLADMGTIATQPELNNFINDFKTAVNQLFTESNAGLTTFATGFPELKTIYDAVLAETSPENQMKKLVELILPELKSRLKLNGLRQALISILKTNPEIVNGLTEKKEVIKAEADGNQPVLYDFNLLEEEMVFNQNQTYSFYLDVPATDDYLIYLSAPQNTVVSLKTDTISIIADNTIIGADGEVKNGTPLHLVTGRLHFTELVISSLPAGKSLSILWRTKGMEKKPVPGSVLYNSTNVTFAKISLIRLLKAAQLQNLFSFTPQEMAYFAAQNTETKDFLNNLDTDGTITSPVLEAQWNILKLLISFNLLKKENEPEENMWLQVLMDPSVKNSRNNLLLEYFNLWQEADLSAILGHFGYSRADLSKLSALIKVTQAMGAVSSIKYPVNDLLTWITHDPAFELVAGIKATVKQKVTEAAWLETMQTVSDPVRNLLRDALVSYILQYKKPSPEVDNPDKLFEYFLIDVEMDACMKTSRIRQALSTVQLFIQRCLMNLEPLVDPASIRADRWAWMKRYRVWEANRKVFLYPENWLEPELRDGKSTLFKELEGELLQSEITDESAELAYLNYLKKLDDIARLEMAGQFLEENEKGNQFDDVLHVFGRTMGNTRQYYYRRFEKGYWTPWEKVNLNVEGDHIFPVIWRKRLFLFWLNMVEKAAPVDTTVVPQTMADNPIGNYAKKNVEITMCWGEYFKGKWTSPKSTELKRPMILKKLDSFNNDLLLIYGRKELIENPAGKFRERLVFYLRYRGGGENSNAVLTFTSKNAPPYIEYKDDTILYNQVRDNLYITYFKPYEGTSEPTDLSGTQFRMPGKAFKVNVEQPSGASASEITEQVLTKKDMLTRGFTVLPGWHPVENQFEAPLSYADEHSTFFARPDEEKVTLLGKFEGYYPVFEFPKKYLDIPVLVEKPVKGWPPEEDPVLDKDILVSNPWDWSTEAIKTNLNIKKMLPTTDIFIFGDTVFDLAGINKDSVKGNF
jgi:hypothetical protein